VWGPHIFNHKSLFLSRQSLKTHNVLSQKAKQKDTSPNPNLSSMEGSIVASIDEGAEFCASMDFVQACKQEISAIGCSFNDGCTFQHLKPPTRP
jgi:hypothetical protein